MAECNGGYDANFVTEVHDLLKCAVCQFVLKNPVIIVECGHRLCKECFENTKDYSILRGFDLLCPLDRTLIDKEKVFPDKGIERRILDLQVKCDNFDKGCTWINELRQLQEHVNMECPFETITCHHDGCDERTMRCTLSHHEEKCPMKEFNQTRRIKHLETTVLQIMERLQVCENQLKLNDQEKKDISALLTSKDEQLSFMATNIKEKDLQLKAIEQKFMEKVLDEMRKGVEEVNNKININTEEIHCLKNSVQQNESFREIENQLKIHSRTLDDIKTNFSELEDQVNTNEQEIGVLKIIIQDNKLHKETLKKQEIQIADLCVKNEEIRNNALKEKEELDDNLKKLDNQANDLIDGLKSEIKSIRILQETLIVGYFEWHITDYNNSCLGNKIRSLPFWTLNGYKCSLSASQSKDEGVLAIYFYLLVGERDRDLVWPFNLKVTFECCSVDNVNHNNYLELDETEVLWLGKPTKKSEEQGFGYPDFLQKPHLDKYIIDDSITIKCYIETMHNNKSYVPNVPLLK